MSRPLELQRHDPRVLVHRTRVQSRKGPIDVIVQLVEPDDDEDVIEVQQANVEAETTGFRRLPLPADPQDSEEQPEADHGFAAKEGVRLGKYLLGRRLGEGTFGTVYVARDTNLDRDVAVKVLNHHHVADNQIRSRFVKEGKAAAKIDHPAIVTVFEAGFEGGNAYIAMELMKGETLTSRLSRSGRIAPITAMEIARQIASALDAAHQVGVVHRDLKPDNIYLVPDPAHPSGERVKILDFGLAKLRQVGEHTAAKLVFGTPRYMSPEQTRSSALVDARSDIYSLGCILFELVASVPPFDGEILDVVRKHQQTKPPRLRAFVPDAPSELENLVASMLAKDPNQRPQTMGAVQRALSAGGALAPGAAATIAPTAAQAMQMMMPHVKITSRLAKGTTPPPDGEEATDAAVLHGGALHANADEITFNPNTPGQHPRPVSLFPPAPMPVGKETAENDAIPLETPPERTSWTNVPSLKPSRKIYGILAAATVIAALLIAFIVVQRHESSAANATQTVNSKP